MDKSTIILAKEKSKGIVHVTYNFDKFEKSDVVRVRETENIQSISLFSDKTYTFMQILHEELELKLEEYGMLTSMLVHQVVYEIAVRLQEAKEMVVIDEENISVEAVMSGMDTHEFIIHKKHSPNIYHFKVHGGNCEMKIVWEAFFAFGQEAAFAYNLYKSNQYDLDSIFSEINTLDEMFCGETWSIRQYLEPMPTGKKKKSKNKTQSVAYQA
jgi:hypothetical protein